MQAVGWLSPADSESVANPEVQERIKQLSTLANYIVEHLKPENKEQQSRLQPIATILQGVVADTPPVNNNPADPAMAGSTADIKKCYDYLSSINSTRISEEDQEMNGFFSAQTTKLKEMATRKPPNMSEISAIKEQLKTLSENLANPYGQLEHLKKTIERFKSKGQHKGNEIENKLLEVPIMERCDFTQAKPGSTGYEVLKALAKHRHFFRRSHLHGGTIKLDNAARSFDKFKEKFMDHTSKKNDTETSIKPNS